MFQKDARTGKSERKEMLLMFSVFIHSFVSTTGIDTDLHVMRFSKGFYRALTFIKTTQRIINVLSK